MAPWGVKKHRSLPVLAVLLVVTATVYLTFSSGNMNFHLKMVRNITINSTSSGKGRSRIAHDQIVRTPSFDEYTCNTSVHGEKICKMIKGRITEAEHTAMIDDLRDFKRLAERRNWTYWIHSGTLLGSWRHHGMIKWDTDIDIMVDIANRSDLTKTYDSLKDIFGYFVFHKNVLVFYQNRSIIRKQSLPNEKWPYVDIVFYTENATHIWADGWPGSFSETKHPKRDVFPLKKRPFEGMMVNSPNNPQAFLRTLYGDFKTCKTHGYNHKKMANADVLKSGCDSLKDLLPFVNRTTKNGKYEETLFFKKKLLHRVKVDI